MPRPIVLGVVGDSGAGKTTITRGLVGLLGEDQVTAVSTDDYHRYDREQRAEHDITPLHPECNYIDILSQHLALLSKGEPILKPVYQHKDGTFGPPVYVSPNPFTVVEGLLGYHTEEMRGCYDVRVFLALPEELRRKWKVQRDTSKRGYTEDQVLADLDKREPDSAQFIRPQERHADMVVTFSEGESGDPYALDAELLLRDSLPQPDLSPFIGEGDRGITIEEGDSQRSVKIAGDIESEQATEIEEAIWDKLHFASHLRSENLGEVRVGDDIHHSDSLGVVQLLILYHMATAKAAVALGGAGPRADAEAEAEDEKDAEKVES
ncbi:MAG: phosphoribulokinase [Gemmatimonadetes bacterium]|nr:phosphoribulokinase [Gemmatimonadota bacterium]